MNDSYVYAVTETKLYIYANNLPSGLSLISTLALSQDIGGNYYGHALATTVSGDYAYVSDWTHAGEAALTIIDVADVNNPSTVKKLKMGAGSGIISRKSAVSGNNLIICNNGSYKVFDVADPATASLLTTYDLEPGNSCGPITTENNLIIARDDIYIRFFTVADLPALTPDYEHPAYGNTALQSVGSDGVLYATGSWGGFTIVRDIPSLMQ